MSPARSPKLLFPTDQLPQRVSPIGPTTSAFSPTCTTCHQRGHYTGACCGTLPSLQHVPACRSREAGQSKRRPIYDPLDEPEAHQDIRRKFGKSPDSMTISFSSHQRLHKRQRLDIEEEHFSDFLQPTPSLSPTATTISADNSTSSSTAIPGPSRYLSLSNMDSSGGVSATFPQRCPNQAKTPRRKTKVAKFAEAEQRKKARKERLKHWDPQRLLELRRELRLEFPKHLETDGRDGTIGLYDGVLVVPRHLHPLFMNSLLCSQALLGSDGLSSMVAGRSALLRGERRCSARLANRGCAVF